MGPDLDDDFFALRDGRFELIESVTPHAAQVELKHGEQLAGRVMKLLPDAHAFVGPNGEILIRHQPAPLLTQDMTPQTPSHEFNFWKTGS
jgi:hypothetical protein